MVPSRCVRCGAVSRDFLCPSCTDYLIAYHPLWLNPALLPGPSLLDLAAPRDMPFVSFDVTEVEWDAPRDEPPTADAVRLIRLLSLDDRTHPMVSVGDADLLHRFLREGRRSTPNSPDARDALAKMYRYLSTSDWMPAHLAAEYRLRADTLTPPARESLPESMPSLEPAAEEVPSASPLPEPSDVTPEAEEPLPDFSEVDLEPVEETVSLPAPGPYRPEPIPTPEPPLPLPSPPTPQPEPEPEPEPEEDRLVASRRAELESIQQALEEERAGMEAWTRSQLAEFRTKEVALSERETAITTKEQEVATRDQAVTDRLLTLEKDAARREVLRFLGRVPGMSEAQADVIATAFPDLSSLQAADEKALTQCRGVTENLARAIRYELVPGEVDQEQHAARLREEAQAFLEDKDYDAALDCYDRLLRDRPEDTGTWFDRADVLVLLNRKEEALQSYRRVLDQDRANRRAWFERGNLLFGLGRLADAVDALREALRLDPTKAGDIALKAEQLRRDGHPNEAVILFQAIVDVSPADVRAVLGLGDSFLGLGDTDAAEALFTQALGKNPQNAPIVFRKGELLERKGRWGAAIQYYNRAIALKWNLVGPWLAKGKILLEHDRAREALECFDKVLTFEPDTVEAWAGKARAHSLLGDPEAAGNALKRAEGLDAQHPSVHAAREQSSVPAGPQTEPEFELPLESPPAELEVPHDEEQETDQDETDEPAVAPDFHSLVKAFEEIEEEPPSTPEPSPADADFQSFVESIEPDEEETYVLLQLAELALEGGDARMALLRYEQAIAQDDRSADAWTGKGVALQQLERYREALDAYDRALSLKPDHPTAQKWRETCLRHLDRGAAG